MTLKLERPEQILQRCRFRQAELWLLANTVQSSFRSAAEILSTQRSPPFESPRCLHCRVPVSVRAGPSRAEAAAAAAAAAICRVPSRTIAQNEPCIQKQGLYISCCVKPLSRKIVPTILRLRGITQHDIYNPCIWINCTNHAV